MGEDTPSFFRGRVRGGIQGPIARCGLWLHCHCSQNPYNCASSCVPGNSPSGQPVCLVSSRNACLKRFHCYTTNCPSPHLLLPGHTLRADWSPAPGNQPGDTRECCGWVCTRSSLVISKRGDGACMVHTVMGVLGHAYCLSVFTAVLRNIAFENLAFRCEIMAFGGVEALLRVSQEWSINRQWYK